MCTVKQSSAFQRGLESYYEDWDKTKLDMVLFELSTDEEGLVELFKAGRARAESDDEIA